MELTLSQAVAFVEHVSAPARTTTVLLGPPGIGKTQGIEEMAARMGKKFGYLLLASTPEEEVHGIFRIVGDGVVRSPIEVLRMACDEPTVLLVDELTHSVASRQTAATTLFNERRVGDRKLHPETIVVAAGNGAEFDGNHDLIPALRSRCNFVKVRGDVAEVHTYMTERIGAPGSTLKNLAVDYAYTAERAPQLIQLEQPANAELWANPRAIEQALREAAAAIDAAEADKVDSKLGAMLFRQAFEGRLGEEVAGAYLAIRKMRQHLPSPQEICDDPNAAKLPTNVETNIAVLGVIGMAAEANADAALVYATRLTDNEVQMAVTQKLIRKMPKTKEGNLARARLLGKVGRGLQGEA